MNWEDDEGAVPFTFAMRKENGQLQFRAGIAVLATEALEQIAKLPGVAGQLRYERRETDDNHYHGNLLIPETLSKPSQKQIAAALALHVIEVIRPPEA